jgi:hypothetical protein
MDLAMVSMKFLSDRDRKKLEEDYADVLAEYRARNDARSPNYNDALLGLARRRYADFVMTYEAMRDRANHVNEQ